MASPHDYTHLIVRWRALCKGAGLRLRSFAEAGKYRLHYIETLRGTGRNAVYISAGIHGDEPASPWALLAWAEAQGGKLRESPHLLLPCLNPWGLVANERTNSERVDLNRSFHRLELPVIEKWRKLLHGREFRVAISLHEDYDAEGLYLYEVCRREKYQGRSILEKVKAIFPLDPRHRIDSYKAVNGLIRRQVRHHFFQRIGYPEAVWLHLHHSAETYTVEAPSEFAIERRIEALKAAVEAAVHLA